MKKDILFISPFEDLYKIAKKLIKFQGFEEIDVQMGDLEEGAKKARVAVNNGTRVIISRGGTYNAILKEVDVPVVEVGITAFDILKSFKLIQQIKEPLAIIGYHNVIKGYDIIEDLFVDMDVTKIILDNTKSVEGQIKECVNKGVKVVVGDTVVNRIAPQYGCKSILIESGEEAVLSAMNEAIRVLKAAQVESDRMQRFMAVIDYTSDGVIATDKDGRVTVFNRNAEVILGTTKEKAKGQLISQIFKYDQISKLIESPSIKVDSIYDLGSTKLALNHVPIFVDGDDTGSIITFQDISKIQSLEKKIRLELSKKGFVAKYNFQDIVHQSSLMQKCIKRARTYGGYDSSVLITGPSGVGKEIFAQSIHNISKRKTGPFVPINCAALPANLIESELFGYVEGAFTGAKKGGKPGIFEMAHKGTIFLDEISELPLDLQARLLRVIQEREVMRVGDNKVIPVDVRIICATNRDLKEMVIEGDFRRDLLFRINILSLNIPSLNERREDIELLIEYFISLFCDEYKKGSMKISSDTLGYLERHHYDGNVRELQGMIERAVITCTGDEIKLDDIIESDAYNVDQIISNHSNIFDEEYSLKELEDKYIKYISNKYSDSKQEICHILGIDRSTLWRKKKKK
ncbi:putative PAS/PAC sensor protein [Alkaliphilus metalliredigens QYMF]|uniref:Putative PAS/PAC sensor protein n=1 Tax=Alkaliphilus metalliredigens (strain QYMF) TaxID=293826 RepID=A6TJU2_ALKMQ|nr:sigma-54-dependent Fis family transcriptional regulator [Alkaliphilus metalliredigens]ABR46460.1 putative PAS/PAC sensor protein [Alkaliphilus metalliredigens QYMF]